MKKWILPSLILLSVLLLCLIQWLNSAAISQKIQISDYTEYGKTQTSNNAIILSKDFTLKFKFLINQDDNVSEGIKYENLFQTANYNQGLRLEIVRTNNRPSAWALVYSDQQNRLKGIDLGVVPQAGTWHDMAILYKAADDSLSIIVDGQTIKGILHSNISLDFSNIIVGKGFNNRIFLGKISQFFMESEFQIPTYYQTILVGFLLGLIYCHYLSRQNFEKSYSHL